MKNNEKKPSVVESVKAAAKTVTAKKEPETANKPKIYLSTDQFGKTPKAPKGHEVVPVDISNNERVHVTPKKVVGTVVTYLPAFASGWSAGKDLTNAVSFLGCKTATKKERVCGVLTNLGKAAIKITAGSVSSLSINELLSDTDPDFNINKKNK